MSALDSEPPEIGDRRHAETVESRRGRRTRHPRLPVWAVDRGTPAPLGRDHLNAERRSTGPAVLGFGLAFSVASLARNLFGATPTEQVRCSCSPNASADGVGDRDRIPWSRSLPTHRGTPRPANRLDQGRERWKISMTLALISP